MAKIKEGRHSGALPESYVLLFQLVDLTGKSGQNQRGIPTSRRLLQHHRR